MPFCYHAPRRFQYQMKSTDRGGAGLGATYVASIKDRGVLFTIATMLLGPRSQYSMVVDVQYGMTNRLRAYGSAKAIADISGRLLVVIWEPDYHFAAPLEHVFVPPPGVHVLSDGAPIRALLQMPSVNRHFFQLDLMDPAHKSEAVDPRMDKHIYVRSAFQIFSKQPYGAGNVMAMRWVLIFKWAVVANSYHPFI